MTSSRLALAALLPTILFSAACKSGVPSESKRAEPASATPVEPAPVASAPVVSDPVATVLAVADEYLVGYYRQFPEDAFVNGYPDAPTDRFSDRSAAARAAWARREDEWLARLASLDPARLEGTEAALPYAYVRELLEASVGVRVCRNDLWNVSPTFNGWPAVVSDALANQSVGTPAERAAALARVRDVARLVDTERANLAEGLKLGLSAARSSVDAVVQQLDEILAAEVPATPFYSPAERDESGELKASVGAVIGNEILPAVRRYRDFLAGEYLNAARVAPGVSANPEGAACYAAAVRFWTSLPLTAEQLHANGLEQIAKIETEMRAIARRSFATDDLAGLLQRLRSERQYAFGSEQEILDFVRAAIDRAAAASPAWFGYVPKAEVIVRPYPAYRQETGGGSYSSGVPGQPGVYELGTYEPEKLPRAALEATTFHETYPGHHLQGAVALQRAGLHPALRYFWNSGSGEGWALYSERLADEMGLYSGDIDRLGMLSNESLRAARLVVDSGIHALGWSRQQAIDYLLAHTASSAGGAASQIDRYIAVPGQSTAYMTGKELRVVSDEVARKTMQQWMEYPAKFATRHFDALKDILDDEEPSYRQ
jgi:uncharacterized protein (DUF885 family)